MMADPAIAPDELEERGPLRRCIATRQVGERARMIRFVLAPDRRIVPDLAARLPGRGFWLSARRDVLEAATARAFARAAKGPVVVPDNLITIIQEGLERRLMDHLGLARRAGQATAGFARVREWLIAGRAGLLVHAADGSEEERRRLVSGCAAVPVCTPLPAAALGQIFGREHAVHVALAPGNIAAALMNDVYRAAGITGVAMMKASG